MLNELEGKSIVVTGGGTGIGRATALACAAAGARVVVADVNLEAGRDTVSVISDRRGEAIFIRTDVSKEEQVESLVRDTLQAFGRLDGAFNNAGLSQTNLLLHELTAEQWHCIQSVNYDGVFFCMKHEIRAMLRSGKGSIVNVSSSLGRVAVPRAAEYCASKGGVLAMTKGAAVDYGAQGIRVNAVLPGITRTPMVESLAAQPQFAELLPRLEARHALGRLGSPEEIASAAVWLLSDASSFVTGAELAVDGGYLAM
ncbi:2,5-dichloro-2,5-cyclohexadiene-1,4-diol dehydrogenase 1 [Paraburkholderia sp. BL23I1N1]|uniref:SDR family NAD(P)-dependent oxidoreductase n=1 Tax=Paraburkholderia sp. BL23I1N1 TaxID=1938802 RepID=UPI000E757C6C|nr:glucose 1-dehydrogenase [Paraburkholderia sp. BL23I1N1]RKE38601.1 2,5-dichloro-2,5-cyclohexadiene-1,4-diol dehydrogenase 1 [Paraburkholderia sp. BL23I1N1]